MWFTGNIIGCGWMWVRIPPVDINFMQLSFGEETTVLLSQQCDPHEQRTKRDHSEGVVSKNCCKKQYFVFEKHLHPFKGTTHPIHISIRGIPMIRISSDFPGTNSDGRYFSFCVFEKFQVWPIPLVCLGAALISRG